MIPIYEFDKISPEQILNRDIQAEEDVSRAVDEVISAVRERGDEALKEYTKRFDGVELDTLQVTEGEIASAWEQVEEDFRVTLQMAADNIRRFHENQVHQDFVLTDQPGIVMG
ncbi:MAG: histidinol dehydrogenase, partial [Oscillibacter sp.]|nr:histidinol dehydrogenase [Oscillibacter sp.]